MIHVDEMPVDIEDLRDWANGYKAMHRISWDDFGRLCDVPGGTLQPFCKGNYAGRNEQVGRKIFKFRQGEQSRNERLVGIPTDPGYFETPTSLLIREQLAIAAAGNITVCAMGSGLGKTMTALDFLGRVSPIWMATMDEVNKSTNNMIRVVEAAIGLKCARVWPSSISAEIIGFLRKRRATLIIDEAGFAQYGALEQLRAWHDATGVGICLMGNVELLVRIESGKERDALARLNRRIESKLVQNMPLEDDILAFCEAWQIFDPGIRKLLLDVAMRPGSGALGECSKIIKRACSVASEDGAKLELAHVRWAVDARARRIIR